jgi:DNA polymerase-3 subunit delta'
MNWDQIVGQQTLKTMLAKSISDNRVSHAQFFVGAYGYGTLALALAFARQIFARENEGSAPKVEHLNHLDLHFSFPVFKEKSSGLSSNFADEFRELVLENPYADNADWSNILQSENKQLTIYAEEIDAQNQRFSLKSYEGGSKVLIIWQADKMNIWAANKFLKFLEEPPKDTFIILTAESSDNVLPTILSRTQMVEIPRIDDAEIDAALQKHFDISEEKRREIVFQAQGDWNVAQKLVSAEDVNSEFQNLFVLWVREAFQVKKKPQYLKNIVIWARNIASWNREKQKNFLEYCADSFRLALLQNYGNADLVYRKIVTDGFKWDGFARYIHGANIEVILNEISEADYHLERNANPKIVWTDLGIKLSRYIHKSA